MSSKWYSPMNTVRHRNGGGTAREASGRFSLMPPWRQLPALTCADPRLEAVRSLHTTCPPGPCAPTHWVPSVPATHERIGIAT